MNYTEYDVSVDHNAAEEMMKLTRQMGVERNDLSLQKVHREGFLVIRRLVTLLNTQIVDIEFQK